MGNKSNPKKKTDNVQEEAYRKFYLKADVSQARFGIILFAIPIIGFIFNDYLFFGFSTEFLILAAIRFFILLVSALEFHYIRNLKNSQSYDRLIFLSTVVLLIGSGVINTFRPENFIVQAIITSVSVLAVYLVLPLRFLYQSMLGWAATIGEALIILFIASPAETPVLFTLFFSMFFANFVGQLASWRLQSYRKDVFNEFCKRNEVQSYLEQYTLHLEELVEEKTEKLKSAERMAAIGATASMVGHDLRNPLTAISGAAYYLKKKYSNELDQKGQEMLELIQNNVQFSDKIINDLLDYSRNIQLDLIKTNPKAIMTESLNMVSLPSNIIVNVSTKEATQIDLDPVKIKRTFVNIIKNAIDAMPEGGKLDIKSETDGENVKFIFSDTGQGISEENQKELFQPLFTTKAKGMGFGLAICQRIIEAHKGRIMVETVVGKGTSIMVELPVNPDSKEDKPLFEL